LVSRELTIELLDRFRASMPRKMMQQFDQEDAGIIHAINILERAGKPLTAGTMSEEMHVSTARVAVLLKKMEQRNLIVRLTDPSDARKTLIAISDYGKNEIIRHKEDVIDFCSAVIEKIGVERFREYIIMSEEIRKIIDEEVPFPECRLKKKGIKND